MDASDYPQDLWFAVFEHVRSAPDFRNLRAVCRLFRDTLINKPLCDGKRRFRNRFVLACSDGDLRCAQFLHNRHSKWSCGKTCIKHGFYANPSIDAKHPILFARQIENPDRICLSVAGIRAAYFGHFELLRWLLSCRIEEAILSSILGSAVGNGQLEIAQWVRGQFGSDCESRFACYAASAGHTHVVHWWVEEFYDASDRPHLLGEAAAAGHLVLAKWLHSRGVTDCSNHYINVAAENGHLEVCQWLHETLNLRISEYEPIVKSGRLSVLRWWVETGWASKRYAEWNRLKKLNRLLTQAIQHGQPVVAEWLLSLGASFEEVVRTEPRRNLVLGPAGNASNCSYSVVVIESLLRGTANLRLLLKHPALNNPPPPSHLLAICALTAGDIETLEWLRVNNLICGSDFAEAASPFRNADPAVIKWVVAHFPLEFGTLALQTAAGRGEKELVFWLHRTLSPSFWSASVMDFAAGSGNLDLVRWLHENRAEGCTTSAMDEAASAGHFHVVSWLHRHRTEGCTADAMLRAASAGHLKIVKFLHRSRYDCHSLSLQRALMKGHVRVAKYLYKHFPTLCRPTLKYLFQEGFYDACLWVVRRDSPESLCSPLEFERIVTFD